jgi:integrase/recombinase XerD
MKLKSNSSESLYEFDNEELQKMFSEFVKNLLSKNGFQVHNYLLMHCIDDYKAFIRVSRSKSYSDSVELTFKYFMDFFPADTKISTITPSQINQLLQKMQETAPKGVAVYYRTAKAGFNWLYQNEYIQKNPFRFLKCPKIQEMEPVIITAGELDKLLQHIKNPIIKSIIRFAFQTGCRLSEVINLTWTSVNLERKTITLGSKSFKTKSRKQSTIPISNSAYEILIIQKEKADNTKCIFVFGKTPDSSYTPDHISKQFKKASRLAGLDESITFHSTRHSCGTYLTQRGVPTRVVQQLLRHSNIKVTERYIHSDIETMRAAFKDIGA